MTFGLSPLQLLMSGRTGILLTPPTLYHHATFSLATFDPFYGLNMRSLSYDKSSPPHGGGNPRYSSTAEAIGDNVTNALLQEADCDPAFARVCRCEVVPSQTQAPPTLPCVGFSALQHLYYTRCPCVTSPAYTRTRQHSRTAMKQFPLRGRCHRLLRRACLSPSVRGAALST